MLDRLRLQGKFDKHFTGGAICHISVGEKIKDKSILIDLMHYAAKCGVVYWSVNYALKRCKNNHIFVDGETCPVCGEGIDYVCSRVVGYFSRIDNWSETRREFDWKNRKFYNNNEINEFTVDPNYKEMRKD
jgi:ribonucleoside-triphosphate reductase